MTAQPVVVAWSGGKDSALALREIRADTRYRVATLFTTVTREYDRISMHGVRRTLLRRQADSLRLPLEEVVISPQASNEEYEAKMCDALEAARARVPGLNTVVFGDLFLSDVRAYRERMLARVGMHGLFPLWLRDTGTLAHEFVQLGFRAVLVCVDTAQLGREFAGREFDGELLRELPPPWIRAAREASSIRSCTPGRGCVRPSNVRGAPSSSETTASYIVILWRPLRDETTGVAGAHRGDRVQRRARADQLGGTGRGSE